MNEMIQKLPRYYRDSPQVAELERVLDLQAQGLRSAVTDTLAQLFVDSATWGLDLWEQWTGLPTDRSRPYAYRRSRITSKLRGQGSTTLAMIRDVAESFANGEVEIEERTAEYTIVIRFVSELGVPPNISDLMDTVNEIKPAHLAVRYEYRFRTWGQVAGLTWGQVGQYTWGEIREEELSGTDRTL